MDTLIQNVPKHNISKLKALFSLANRGEITFMTAELRNEFVACYQEIANEQQLTFQGKKLTVSKHTSVASGRRFAKLHKASRELEAAFSGERVHAVVGRNDIVSRQVAVGHMDSTSEVVIWDWQAFAQLSGEEAAMSLRACLQ